MTTANTRDATGILDENDDSIDQVRRNPAGLTTFVLHDDKGGRTWFAVRRDGVFRASGAEAQFHALILILLRSMPYSAGASDFSCDAASISVARYAVR